MKIKGTSRGIIVVGILYFAVYELTVLLYDFGTPHQPLSKALIITSHLVAYLVPGYIAGVASKHFCVLNGAIVGFVSPAVLVLHKLLGLHFQLVRCGSLQEYIPFKKLSV